MLREAALEVVEGVMEGFAARLVEELLWGFAAEFADSLAAVVAASVVQYSFSHCCPTCNQASISSVYHMPHS